MRELADQRDDLAVVGRLQELVRRRLVQLELDVVQERLQLLALSLERPVTAGQLETGDLDDDGHAYTARAAVSASTCSRTSWTRRIVAPRSQAAPAAPTLAATEPVVASGSPSSFPSELFREIPTTTGRPSAVSSPRRRISSKLCSTVLPKPMPGSRHTRSSAIPAATATPNRSSRKAATSETTSS